MKGTEKQIAWAEDIEKKYLENIDNQIASWQSRVEKYGLACEADYVEMLKVVRQAAVNAFEQMQDAALVIERRNYLPNAQKLMETAETVAHNTNRNRIEVIREMCGIK